MQKFFYKLVFILLFSGITSNISAQEVRVSAVLDSSKIRIGEQVKVDIYLSYQANQKDFKITWPQIGDTLTSHIEVVSVSPIDTTIPDKDNPTALLQHQQIIVSVYDSGYFAIPGFQFILNNDSANSRFTETLMLEVHTVPTDSSAKKTKDIKPPLDEPFNWKWYLETIYWSVGGLIVLAAILLWVYYMRKQKANTYVEPEKPKVPAHITALATLDRIKENGIWKQDKIKEYYSEISDCIRLYIEERFMVNALESTTDEIMLAFRSQVVDKESKEKLQQLLMLSDLVKFAKQFPIENEHLFTLQNAYDFVNGTKREEEIQLEENHTDTNIQQP